MPLRFDRRVHMSVEVKGEIVVDEFGKGSAAVCVSRAITAHGRYTLPKYRLRPEGTPVVCESTLICERQKRSRCKMITSTGVAGETVSKN